MQEILSSSTPPIMSLVNRLQTTSTPLVDTNGVNIEKITDTSNQMSNSNDSSSVKLDFLNSNTKHLNAYNQAFSFNNYGEYNPNSVAAALQHYTNNSTYGFEHHQLPIDYQSQRTNWSTQVSPTSNLKSKNFSSLSSTNTSSSNESDYYNPLITSNYDANNAITSSNDYNSLVRSNLFPYTSSNTANVNTGYYYHPNAQNVQTPYYSQFLSNTVMPSNESKLRYDSVSSSSSSASSSSSSSCSSSTSSLLNHLSPINTNSRSDIANLEQENPNKKIKLSVVSNLISSVKEENNSHSYQPSSSSSSSVSSSSTSFNSSPSSLSQCSTNNKNSTNSSLSPKIINSMPITTISTTNSSSIKSLNNISNASAERSPSSLGTNNSTCSYSQNNMMNSLTSAESYDWMKPVKNQSNGKTRTKDKYRVVYTEPQRVELEKEFLYSKYITIKRKAELSQTLSLSERQIKIWFQNRRAKERKSNRKQKTDSNKVTSTTNMRNSTDPAANILKSQNMNFSDDEEDNYDEDVDDEFDDDDDDEEDGHEDSFTSTKKASKSKPKSKMNKKEIAQPLSTQVTQVDPAVSNNLTDFNLPRYNFNSQMYPPHHDLTNLQNNNEQSPLIASFMNSQNSAYTNQYYIDMQQQQQQQQSYSSYNNYQISQQPSQFNHQNYNFMNNPNYQTSNDYTAYQNHNYQTQFMPSNTYTPTTVNASFLPTSTCVKQIITSSPLPANNINIDSPSNNNLMVNVTASSSLSQF